MMKRWPAWPGTPWHGFGVAARHRHDDQHDVGVEHLGGHEGGAGRAAGTGAARRRGDSAGMLLVTRFRFYAVTPRRR
jgi:hypothetical protein